MSEGREIVICGFGTTVITSFPRDERSETIGRSRFFSTLSMDITPG